MPGDDALGVRRVLVYGVTGSGKTTLAERLSGVTGLPWYSADDLTWETGWVEVAPEEQRRRSAAICARDEWILDTAYAKWRDIPLARAELIVALDYPRWVSLQRLVRRTVARCRNRTPICNGNTETLGAALGPESLVRWHFKSFPRKRSRIREWMTLEEGPRVVHLTRPRATEAWLVQLGHDRPCAGLMWRPRRRV